MGEQKKSAKRRVPAHRIANYWTWDWAKNKAKKALRAYKASLRLHPEDEPKARGAAQAVLNAAAKQAETSAHKPNIDAEAEFTRLVRKGVK
jgi:hypothetical protein